MRFLRLALIGLFFSIATAGFAKDNDYNFQQERMLLSQDSVVIVSSFDNQDHISAYSYTGNFLWNAPFHAKILSWQMAQDYIFVFSKDRRGSKTYLTCLDRFSGRLVWQKE